MTNTKIIAAGVLLAAGEEISNPTKAALQSTTRGYTLEGIVTNGAIPTSMNEVRLELRWITSNDTGVAATVVPNMALNAQTKTVKLKHGKGAITYFATKVFIPTGSNIFVWLNSPLLPANAAIDVWLNEIA